MNPKHYIDGQRRLQAGPPTRLRPAAGPYGQLRLHAGAPGPIRLAAGPYGRLRLHAGAPGPIRPAAGILHIWQADLDAVGPRVARVLDEPERERAARILREPVRRRWMAARGLLRMLLGAYTGEHPSAVRFAQGPRGKPILDLPGVASPHFNLSHSGGLAVYALTEVCDVGVDVELIARGCGARAYPRDFLRTWVKREATGKLIGVGVGNTTAPPGSHRTQPWISELDLGYGAVGAVALNAAPVDFQVNAFDFRAPGSILPSRRIATLGGESHVSK